MRANMPMPRVNRYDEYEYADGEEGAYEDDEPGGKRRNTIKIGLAVLGVVVFGSAAAFGYRIVFRGGTDGPPPLIRADTSPTKVMPAASTPMAARSRSMIGSAMDRANACCRARSSRSTSGMPARNANGGVVVPLAGGAAVAPYPTASSDRRCSTPQADRFERAEAGPHRHHPRRPRRTGCGRTGARPHRRRPAPAAPRPAAQAAQAAAPSQSAAPLALAPQSQTVRGRRRYRRARPRPLGLRPRAKAEAEVWVVQISAQKTEGEAQSAFRAAQTKYSVLGSYQPLIRKKDQGDRGVFYAAQVGPLARDEANQLCENLKSAGGSCFIQRN